MILSLTSGGQAQIGHGDGGGHGDGLIEATRVEC